MSTVIGVILITAAIIYVAGTILWAIDRVFEWDAAGPDWARREAARQALAAPLWPLLTLRLLVQLFVDLRTDAKENP